MNLHNSPSEINACCPNGITRSHRRCEVVFGRLLSWSNFGSRLDDADRQEVAKRTAKLLALTGRMPRLALCTAAADLALAVLVFYDFCQIRRARAKDILRPSRREQTSG